MKMKKKKKKVPIKQQILAVCFLSGTFLLAHSQLSTQSSYVSRLVSPTLAANMKYCLRFYFSLRGEPHLLDFLPSLITPIYSSDSPLMEKLQDSTRRRRPSPCICSRAAARRRSGLRERSPEESGSRRMSPSRRRSLPRSGEKVGWLARPPHTGRDRDLRLGDFFGGICCGRKNIPSLFVWNWNHLVIQMSK